MAVHRASTERGAAFRKNALSFCEGLLNWVEIRGIRRQMEQRGASGLNGLPYGRAFVGA